KKFHRRICYANVQSDFSVRYLTSSILFTNYDFENFTKAHPKSLSFPIPKLTITKCPDNADTKVLAEEDWETLDPVHLQVAQDRLKAFGLPDSMIRMAKSLHGPGLSWRKVIICLDSSAHNGIVVRRELEDIAGSPVIDHFLKNVEFKF